MFTAASASSLNRIKIGIVGAGMSGSHMASILSAINSAKSSFPEPHFHIDVFDAGRTIGGRCSHREEAGYLFDHGSQYIPDGKSPEFRYLLEGWKQRGLIHEWSGRFQIDEAEDFSHITGGKKRWVPVPNMSSICSHLLQCEHKRGNLSIKSGCSVKASLRHDRRWVISDAKTEDSFGEYDWIVCSDRSCLAKDFDFSAASPATTEAVDKISSQVSNVPVIACMVGFDQSLAKHPFLASYPFSGAKLSKDPVLSWISRSSSKPGRTRTDGSECWVLHSTTGFAEDIIREASVKGGTFEEIRRAVNAAAEAPMFDSFVSFLRGYHLGSTKPTSKLQVEDLSKPSFLRTHRWGAAFPTIVGEMISGVKLGNTPKGRAFLSAEDRLAVIGDYFCHENEGRGRLEGACLSALDASEQLIEMMGLH